MIRPLLGSFFAATLCAPAAFAGQAPAAGPASTISANPVVVDVVVTDAQQNPVHNLAASDFKLSENGQAQTIETFEEHHSWEAAAPIPSPPKLFPGTFTNYTNVPIGGALNILLLDLLNTPIAGQHDARNQMLSYLKEAHPGARVAIFGLNTRLILLQGFTSDPELLSDVLNGRKGLPSDSGSVTDAVNGDSPGAGGATLDTAEDAAAALGNTPAAAQLVARLRQLKAETSPSQLRARLTLDALNQLARSLSGLPGRKNLIWFSGSFPIDILPDGERENPLGAAASAEDEFRETADLLARAQVAVYPIAAGATLATPELSANSPGVPQAMAEATGGEALGSTNGLKGAVEKAIDAGSNYYTLTYTPTNRKRNGEYRKVRVDIARSGLTLAYRRGYFADDPNLPRRSAEAAGTGQAAPYSAMHAAMMQGGPDPTEIVFAAYVRPATAGPEPGVAPGNTVEGKSSGPYRRYRVFLGVDARDIECDAAADGARHCALEAAILVYDANSAVLNSATGRIESSVSADRYASMLKDGIHFGQDISVPVSGEFSLRVGVHDKTTNKVGAVEIPIDAVSKLPPLAATAQPKDQPPDQH